MDTGLRSGWSAIRVVFASPGLPRARWAADPLPVGRQLASELVADGGLLRANDREDGGVAQRTVTLDGMAAQDTVRLGAQARDRGTGLKVHPVRAQLHGDALSSSTKA